MTKWIAAALAATFILGGSAAIGPAAAASSPAALQKPEAQKAADRSARRRARHPLRYAYRAYQRPHYYDRPDDYRPYPYILPAPFFLGFAYQPWW